MTKRITIALVALLLVVSFAPTAAAGPREREIKQLESQVATLQRTLRTAIEFRAKYRTLKANIYFFENLLRQDQQLIQRMMRYLNSPVSLLDAFPSWEPSSWDKALKARHRYRQGATYLWLKCRFGLTAVKARQLYTIRIDLVDPHSGVRIYQSFGPFQRRTVSMIEKFNIPIKGLRVAAGSYKLRVHIEVGSQSAKKLVPFTHSNPYRPAPPPPPHRPAHSL
ncbi:MAG: hypothetical protein ABI333_05065 [bacterium]